MKPMILSALALVSLFSWRANAWFMDCRRLDNDGDRKIAIGFAENGALVNLEHYWLKSGVHQGAVAYSETNQVNIAWPLGVYSGNSKNRGLSLTVYQKHNGSEYIASATDFDFSSNTMETYQVLCNLKP